MSWDDIGDTVCPIARSLSVVGDRWTMLILRELFMDVRRFDDLQAQTGMSSHLLSLRLKRLEEDGVVERRLYSERPPRYEHRLTRKGRDLEPVIFALRAWGTKWSGLDPDEEPAMKIVHKDCGGQIGSITVCSTCREPFTGKDLQVTLGKRFAAERARRAAHAKE